MDFARAVPLPGTLLSLLHLAPLRPGPSLHVTSSRNSLIMTAKSGLGASPCVPMAHGDSAIVSPCMLVYLLPTGHLFVGRPYKIHTLAIAVSLGLNTVSGTW